jgi:xanthine dehydrogenase YagR molybdenum-binding subunit
MAIADKKSPLYGQQESAVQVENGRMFLTSDTTKGETYAVLLKRQKLDVLEAEGKTNVSTRETKTTEANPASSQQNSGQQGSGGQQGGGQQSGSGGEKKPEENPFAKADESQDRKSVAFHSFGAHFVKVLVDPLTGFVRVSKVVSVMDVGTVLNEKTARSQIIGGAIWGLGQALTEATAYDPNNGRPVTKDLADYHVPSHADIPEFDIQFIGKPDMKISPVGSRGIGEIGTTGITAAIINAVHHATGKWIRELPATPDKVMG